VNDKGKIFTGLLDEDISLTHDSITWGKKKADYIDADSEVRIGKIVVDYIAKISKSDTKHELGGILLGNYKEIEEGYYRVNVNAAIKALHTEAGKANIKFTHETWEYIDKIKEEKFPSLKIVGWFHTHPGFGIFLSDYDLFIQNNFFNLPWQIAYVVDPVGEKHEFFGWSNGKIVKVPFKIENGPKISGMQKRPFLKKGNGVGNKIQKILRALTIFFAVLLMGSGAYNYYLYNEKASLEIERQELEQENTTLVKDKKDMESEKNKLTNDIDKLRVERNELRTKLNDLVRLNYKIDRVKEDNPELEQIFKQFGRDSDNRRDCHYP